VFHPNPCRPATSEASEGTKATQLLVLRGEEKAAALYEFDPPWAGKGEYREAGSREISVRNLLVTDSLWARQ